MYVNKIKQQFNIIEQNPFDAQGRGGSLAWWAAKP
jgi:hypothetical protein